MSFTYYGYDSPYAQPACIETGPLVSSTGISVNVFAFSNGDRLTIEVSTDGGFNYSSYNWVFTTPNNIFSTPQNLIDFLNINLAGSGATSLEWYIPGPTSLGKDGVLTQYSYGNRVGVRTKNLVGDRAVLRLSSGINANTAVSSIKFNAPIGTFNRGVAGFTEIIPQPAPFDPFRALSVQLYEKALMDRDFSLVTQLRLYTEVSRNMRVESTNGTSIVISNLPATVQYNGVSTKPIFVNDQGASVTITSANLGAAFANNTWYYVYNYWNAGTSTLNIEISTTGPSANPIFKNGDQTRRYMFCFRTDGGAAIIPFVRTGNIHNYLTSQSILTNGNADAAAATISTANFIPPISKIGIIRTQFVVASGSLSFYLLYPGGLGNNPGQSNVIAGFCDNNGGKNDTFNFPILNNSIDYLVNNALDFLSMSVNGFID